MTSFHIQIDSNYRSLIEYPFSTDFVVYNSTFNTSSSQTYMQNPIFYQYRWLGNTTLWFPGASYIQTQFIGTIAGQTLTVTSILTTDSSGLPSGKLAVGQILTNSPSNATSTITIQDGTTITGYGTGVGGIGTYFVSLSQTVATSTAMTTNFNNAYQENNSIFAVCNNILSTNRFRLPLPYVVKEVNYYSGLLFAIPQTFSSFSTLTPIITVVGSSILYPVYGVAGIAVTSTNLGYPTTLSQYNTTVYIDPPPLGGKQATAFANFGVSSTSSTGWDLLSITMTEYGSGYVPTYPPRVFVQSSVYQATATIQLYDPIFNVVTLDSSMPVSLLTTGSIPFAIFNPSNYYSNNMSVLGVNSFLSVYSQNYVAQLFLKNGMSSQFWVENTTRGWSQRIKDFLFDNFRDTEMLLPMSTVSSSFSSILVGTVSGTTLTVLSLLSGSIEVGQYIQSVAIVSLPSTTQITAQLTSTTFSISDSTEISSPSLFVTTTVTVLSSTVPASPYEYGMNDLIQIRSSNVSGNIFTALSSSLSQALYGYTFVDTFPNSIYSYQIYEKVVAIPVSTSPLTVDLLTDTKYATFIVTNVAYPPTNPAYLNVVSMQMVYPGYGYVTQTLCYLIPSTTTTFLSSYNTIKVDRTSYAVEYDASKPNAIVNANAIATEKDQDLLSFIVYAPKNYTFPVPSGSTSFTPYTASFVTNSTTFTITASISGTLLTVTAISPSSGGLVIGQEVVGSLVSSDTVITALGTGTGGVGTYTVSVSQTVSSSVMTVYSGPNSANMLMTVTPSGTVIFDGQLISGANIPSASSVISATSTTDVYNVYFPTASLTTSVSADGSLSIATFTASTPITSGTTDVSFVASIEGTTMTVTAITPSSSLTIQVGTLITGNGVSYGTIITAIVSGTGGVGVYTVAVSQTIASQTMYVSTITVASFNGIIPYKTVPYSESYIPGSFLFLSSASAGIAVGQYLTSSSLKLQAKIVSKSSALKWGITQYLDAETITPSFLNNGESSPYVSRTFDVPTTYVSFRFISFLSNFIFYDLYNLNYNFSSIFDFTSNDPTISDAINSSYNTAPPYIIDAGTIVELIPVYQRPVGLNMPLIAYNQPVCYNVRLISLSIPNQPVVGLSVLPSFFPYLLVEMQNTSGLASTINSIYSNNPNTSTVTFVCHIANPRNQEISNFVVVHAFQSNVFKFLPGDHIRVRIALPNGQTMVYVFEEENILYSQSSNFTDLSFLRNFYAQYTIKNITLNLSFSLMRI